MPRSAVSDMVLHRLPMSHKKDTRHIWVNVVASFCSVAGLFEPCQRRVHSGARCTDVRLYTLRIKIGTNQRELGELSNC